MDKEKFRRVESEEEFVQLLRRHDLYREHDVTFDDFDEGNNYVYTGDDFRYCSESSEGGYSTARRSDSSNTRVVPGNTPN